MSNKFVILTNGLRDQSGHYYETSISLAEAARRGGWQAILATHVDCPASLVPDWLESYAIFCTDHWMAGPPAEPPDLARIRLNPHSRPRITINDVRQGEATVREFLASRFEGLKPEDGLPSPSRTVLDGLGRPPSQRLGEGAQRMFHRYRTSCERAIRRLDRAAYYLLPPAVYLCLMKVAAWSVPPILHPDVQAKIAAKLRERLRGPTGPSEQSVIDYGPCGPETAKALKKKVSDTFSASDVIGKALVKLRAANMAHEVEFAMLFKRDLERFLAVADIGAGDHVFLGTAHPRELLAILLLCRQSGTDRWPTFHLEFRHPLLKRHQAPKKGTGPFCADNPLSTCRGKHKMDPSPYAHLHQVFFALYEEAGTLPNIRFYTDTEELSRDYAPLANQPFGVLPIPFRHEWIAPLKKGTGPFWRSTGAPSDAASHKMDLSPFSGPLRIAFVGEARDEKGFAWLPDLIEDLAADYVSTGKVRFLIQANLGDPRYNPLSNAALDRLKCLPKQMAELFGLDGPLSPAHYYQLISASHIILVPYDRERYRASSSGTLTEAIAGGRPAVVPSGTWMAAQLPSAAGEAYDDYASFVAAVRRVIDDYPTYAARAAACRGPWLAKHSPDALIRAVTTGVCQERIAA